MLFEFFFSNLFVGRFIGFDGIGKKIKIVYSVKLTIKCDAKRFISVRVSVRLYVFVCA